MVRNSHLKRWLPHGIERVTALARVVDVQLYILQGLFPFVDSCRSLESSPSPDLILNNSDFWIRLHSLYCNGGTPNLQCWFYKVFLGVGWWEETIDRAYSLLEMRNTAFFSRKCKEPVGNLFLSLAGKLNYDELKTNWYHYDIYEMTVVLYFFKDETQLKLKWKIKTKTKRGTFRKSQPGCVHPENPLNGRIWNWLTARCCCIED